MDFSEQQHKKVIGIAFIILSALGLGGILIYDFFMTGVFEFAQTQNNDIADVRWLLELVNSFIWGIALLFLVPRLIIGIALVQGKSWANIPALIFGIIGLANIPIGTIIGVYSILVFTSKPKEVNTNY